MSIKTKTQDTVSMMLRALKMETDSDKIDRDKSFELEDAQTHVATTNANEASCQKLINLPSPRVALGRTDVKLTSMEHMLLLIKMDALRFMENQNTRAIFMPMNASIAEC